MHTSRRFVLRSLAAAATAALLPPARAADDRARRLIVAYNDDYAPYSWIEDGTLRGILPDALGLLLAGLPDLKLESVGLPWRRVQAEVRAGISDAMCTFASEERQEYTLFHKIPVVTLRPHLFYAAGNPARKAIEAISRREDLMKLRLVDLKGNNWAEQNLKDFPQIEFVPGHDNVFKMIMAGRGDAHVSLSPIVTAWRIRKLGLPSGDIVSRPAPYIAADVPFHLLVRKTHPRAAEILRHTDDMLKKPGTLRAIEDITQRYL